MRHLYLFLLISVLCVHWECVAAVSIDVFVTPTTNYTLPITSDVNVTYDCAVDEGSQPEWTVDSFQIPSPDDSIALQFAQIGIFIEVLAPNMTRLIITPAGRMTLLRNAGSTLKNIVNTCRGILNDLERGNQSVTVSVTVYDRPDAPVNLDLMVSEDMLILVWGSPANAPAQIQTNYTVTITSVMPGSTQYGSFILNSSTTSFSVHFLEEAQAGKPCEEFQFFVSAENDAGVGDLAVYNETVPISANTSSINDTLSRVSLELEDGDRVRLKIEFKTVKSCSDNFPIQDYIINLNREPALIIPASDLGVEVLVIVELNSTNSRVPISHNRFYMLTVTVRSEVSMRESAGIFFQTTDVQTASVVFHENNILLRCDFANRTSSLGCLFRFSPNSNGTNIEEFFLARSEGERVLTQCNSTVNQLSAYTGVGIAVFDVESNGMLGDFRIQARYSEEFGQANFTRLTGCQLAEDGNTVNVAAAVVVPIVVLIIIAVVVIAIFVPIGCWKRKQYKEKLELSRSETEKLQEDLQTEKKKITRKPSLTPQGDGIYTADIYPGDVLDDIPTSPVNGNPPSIQLREPSPSTGSVSSSGNSATTPPREMGAGGPPAPTLDVLGPSSQSTTSYSPPRTRNRPPVKRSFSEGAEREPLLLDSESQSENPIHVLIGKNSFQVRVRKAQLKLAIEKARRGKRGSKGRSRSASTDTTSGTQDEHSPLVPIPHAYSDIQFHSDLLDISEEQLETVGEESGSHEDHGTLNGLHFQAGDDDAREGSPIQMKDLTTVEVETGVGESSA